MNQKKVLIIIFKEIIHFSSFELKKSEKYVDYGFRYNFLKIMPA